ncbi:MAG: hypothetical protein LBJ70_01530 [Holosporales bacterium]|nr:hypothetical protein [Holosporales bacterium]
MRRRKTGAFSRRNAGFGLLDTAISLAVVGVMTVAVFKGMALWETAKTVALLSQVDQIRMAVFQHQEQSRNTVTVSSKEENVGLFKALNETGVANLPLGKEGFPTSKLGGLIALSSTVEGAPGNWIVVAGSVPEQLSKFKGAVTPEQAEAILRKGGNGDPESGSIRAITGEGSEGQCITGKKLNTDNKSKACVLLFRLDF